MDYDKLIERLKQKDGLWCSIPSGENLIADAAAALSTLQTENEKLRAELECVTAERDAAAVARPALITHQTTMRGHAELVDLRLRGGSR